MLEEPYKTKYRHIRNFWGLALAIMWIVYWWIRLTDEKAAALAVVPEGHGFFGWLSESWNSTGVESHYASMTFYAVISAPLAFVVTHYFARWRVEQMARADVAAEESQQRQSQARRNAELAQLRYASESEAMEAERSTERQQLILGFADIEAQLKVLEGERDELRRTRALLNLTQYVASLYAKLSSDKIKRALSADPALGKMIENSLARMRALKLEGETFFVLLVHTLTPEPDVSENPPVPVGVMAQNS